MWLFFFFLQSGDIREPSKVRTRGCISSHLEEEEEEGGGQEQKMRSGDVILFLDAELFLYSFHLTVCVCLSLLCLYVSYL